MPRINFLLRVSICFLFIFLPLFSMDQWFYDRFFQLRGAKRGATPFLLVRVNDGELYPYISNFDREFPREGISIETRPRSVWHRQFYETLLNRIQAGNPRQVIFTSFYEGVDEGVMPLPYDNLLFAAALNEENKLVPPPTPLATGDNYGFGNIFPDGDNIVRRTHLSHSFARSLALQAYFKLSQEPITHNLVEPMWIDFRGPQGSYPEVSGMQVFNEDYPPALFQNKIVLIGRDSAHASTLETPYGSMSKLEIQANIIDTFLSHREIHMLPRYVTLIFAAVAVALSIGIIVYFPLTLAWLILLVTALLFGIIVLFLFSQFKIWTGIANPIFCIFGTHLLMLGYKLGKQEEEQWKIQQESDYLKELDQFKNNFISLFSHDLKTPIAKIKAITDRILNNPNQLTPEAAEAFKLIDKTNCELSRYISDILKVTKMETMSVEPRTEVIDLNRLVEMAVQRLKFFAEEKNIEIILDLEPLFSMEGDQHLIQEVITNLVENAIKYSPPERRVIIRTSEEDGKVRVSVVDQGEGIPAEEIPRVTGKFYRGKAAGEKTKGTGLGLYLAKYFVEMHQGALEIKSELGRGTEVSFWLPLPA